MRLSPKEIIRKLIKPNAMKKKYTLTVFSFGFIYFVFTLGCQAQWVQKGQSVFALDSFQVAGFAADISDDGEIMAIGFTGLNDEPYASPMVRIYKNVNSIWTQMGDDILGDLYHLWYGQHLTLSGDGQSIAVAASSISSPVTMWRTQVYHFNSENWILRNDGLFPDTTLSNYPISFSFSNDGNIFAYGVPGTWEIPGYVKVFSYVDNVWVQLGQTLENESDVIDTFGNALGISGDGTKLAIGNRENSEITQYNGSVKVYKLVNDTWIQEGSEILGDTFNGFLGNVLSLSADGTTLATNSMIGEFQAMTKIYRMDPDASWTQMDEGIIIPVSSSSDSPLCLSADGNIIAIGAPFAGVDSNGQSGIGEARVFSYTDSGWEQMGETFEGSGETNHLGYSLGLSADGKTIVMGEPLYTIDHNKSGVVKVFTFTSPVSVHETSGLKDLKIYPNPAQGQVTIQLKRRPSNGEISILTLSGKKVYSAPIHDSETRLDLFALANGIYALQIRTEDGMAVEKLVLQK